MADTLWTLRGSQPVAWQIPLWGVRKGEYIELIAAVPLLNCQKLALHAKIAERGFSAQGIHKVRPQPFSLLRAREHAPGTQPEDLLIWGPRRLKPNTPERQSRGEFIDALALTGIGTPMQCEFWFKSICNLMLDWLVNQDRSIDLYFAILHPTHFSLNWYNRLRDESKGRGQKNQFSKPHFLNGCPVRLEDNRRECRRRIHLEETSIFRKFSRRVEEKRYAVLKKQGYAATIERLYLSQEKLWSRHYRFAKADVLALPARLVACNPPGSKVVVPSSAGRTPTNIVRRGRSARRILRNLHSRARKLDRIHEKRLRAVELLRELVALKRILAGSNDRHLSRTQHTLRELLSLRSFFPELRETWGDVVEPAERETRALWMLVRLSYRKLHAEKLLVERLNKRREWVAKRIKQLSQ